MVLARRHNDSWWQRRHNSFTGHNMGSSAQVSFRIKCRHGTFSGSTALVRTAVLEPTLYLYWCRYLGGARSGAGADSSTVLGNTTSRTAVVQMPVLTVVVLRLAA